MPVTASIFRTCLAGTLPVEHIHCTFWGVHPSALANAVWLPAALAADVIASILICCPYGLMTMQEGYSRKLHFTNTICNDAYNSGLYSQTMKSISEIIGEGRRRAGLNQSELARRLGITPQSVQAWESGRATPRPAMLTPLADALGMEAATLIAAILDGTPGDDREKALRLIRQAYDDRKAELDSELTGSISVWSTLR